MKISGFTIIKNALINDYPIVEAITSVLPLVDEMIVLSGDSEDETEQLIDNIDSEKIKHYRSVWDPGIKEGGKILAVETDKSFDLVPKDSDWAFYIQADEVVHEKYHAAILEAAEKYQHDLRVDGILFNYLHFYGTYDYVGDSRRWYHKEVRLIRNDKTIRAYRDAQGFRKQGKKLNVKPADAYIYHYGWVKSPHQMREKQKHTSQYWSDRGDLQKELSVGDIFDFSDFDSLEKFTDTHPAVMQKRIAEKNWQIKLDISKKKFPVKDRFLYWFEKKTGIRPFDFRNYKII